MSIGRRLNEYSIRCLLAAPSLLAADFGHLADQLCEMETAGAELLHYDVMDGHFVPNISMGPPVLSAIRKCTQVLFDVHLMLTNPRKYILPFVKSGADHITIHVECDDDISETLDEIHAAGVSAGLSLKPNTPAEVLAPYLNKLDMVLVMTVEPGFGGQSFMSDQIPKINEVRKLIEKSGYPIHLEVDGGIDAATAPLVREAGANILVAGSSVFRHPEGIKAGIEALRR